MRGVSPVCVCAACGQAAALAPASLTSQPVRAQGVVFSPERRKIRIASLTALIRAASKPLRARPRMTCSDSAPSATDSTYAVTNSGNTTHSYRVALYGNNPTNTPLQLIVTKNYSSPASVGCSHTFVCPLQVSPDAHSFPTGQAPPACTASAPGLAVLSGCTFLQLSR